MTALVFFACLIGTRVGRVSVKCSLVAELRNLFPCPGGRQGIKCVVA